ncbi:UNVERIFIED_CONTAM: hypothetical protein GTU68_047127 [Idotea baltica]|nr:hypothetical protein [Idotea baltica]
MNHVIDKARTAGTPVIWVQHDDDELPKGTDGWQIVDELQPLEGDARVYKNFRDSFELTSLEDELVDKDVGTLVVMGAQTDYCVRWTLHGALDRGYGTVLVGDAHTTDAEGYGDLPSGAALIAHTNSIWASQEPRATQPQSSKPPKSSSPDLSELQRTNSVPVGSETCLGQVCPAHEVGDQGFTGGMLVGPVLGMELGADDAHVVVDGDLNRRDFGACQNLKAGWGLGHVKPVCMAEDGCVAEALKQFVFAEEFDRVVADLAEVAVWPLLEHVGFFGIGRNIEQLQLGAECQ